MTENKNVPTIYKIQSFNKNTLIKKEDLMHSLKLIVKKICFTGIRKESDF